MKHLKDFVKFMREDGWKSIAGFGVFFFGVAMLGEAFGAQELSILKVRINCVFAFALAALIKKS